MALICHSSISQTSGYINTTHYTWENSDSVSPCIWVCLRNLSHMILLWLVRMEHSWDMAVNRAQCKLLQNDHKFSYDGHNQFPLSLSFPIYKGRGWSSPAFDPSAKVIQKSLHLVLIICMSVFLFSSWGAKDFSKIYILTPRNAYPCPRH